MIHSTVQLIHQHDSFKRLVALESTSPSIDGLVYTCRRNNLPEVESLAAARQHATSKYITPHGVTTAIKCQTAEPQHSQPCKRHRTQHQAMLGNQTVWYGQTSYIQLIM